MTASGSPPRFRSRPWLALKAGLLAATLGLAGAAHALMVGDIQIKSFVGQSFYAEVPYTSAFGDDVQVQCIRTKYDIVPKQQPIMELPEPVITVVPGVKGGKIVIRTVKPLNEPLYHLYLNVNCGKSISMIRDYMVPLSPMDPHTNVRQSQADLYR